MRCLRLLALISLICVGGAASAFADSGGAAGPDVYVGGDFGLLKNGVRQSGYGCVRSIFVSGNDVYAAGWENNAEGVRVARLWKNGAGQNLGDGKYESQANSVFVSGNDVYVAGWERGAQGVTVARFWKNGAANVIQDELSANAVFVSGNDLYLGGSFGLMKNGVRQDGYFWVSSVFVSGDEVHATGFDGWETNHWRNGRSRAIAGTDASAESVFVSGRNVYLAGWSENGGRDRFAKIWENGRMRNITDGKREARAYSVFASGNDVYVAGWEHNEEGIKTARLWKNGVDQNIGVEGVAYSVYVVSVSNQN